MAISDSDWPKIQMSPSASSKTITLPFLCQSSLRSSLLTLTIWNLWKSLRLLTLPFWLKIKGIFRSDHDRANLKISRPSLWGILPNATNCLQSYFPGSTGRKATTDNALRKSSACGEILNIPLVQASIRHPKVSVDQRNGFNQSRFTNPILAEKARLIHFQKVGQDLSTCFFGFRLE